MSLRFLGRALTLSALVCCAFAAPAQVPLDRADPAVQQQALPVPQAPPPPPPAPTQADEKPVAAPREMQPITVDRIVIAGNDVIPSAAFDAIFSAYLHRPLGRSDLQQLVKAVGDTARGRGYVLASASVDLSAAAEGVLRVQLDEGRIDAVRLLGIRNGGVERALQRLVTGRPILQRELERAILLAGDVPGAHIDSSRYVREGGFGILLVEASQDRASFYGQIENRGSDEIGPIRSTILGSLRNVAASGDELSFIAANTPIQPREFAFLRSRYAMSPTSSGGVLSVSASYGRTHPGASLRRLDVIGHSYDVGFTYQQPLHRSRSASLWGAVDFRGAVSDQSLAGTPIRDDHIATLAANLNGEARVLGGNGRAETALIWGLPLAGTTRRGERLASRPDGSARFVVAHAYLDWTRPLGDPFSLRLSAEGQLASRPLLASAELGAGGPSFGRAYDYGERTGDQGVLGSAELRAELPVGSLKPLRGAQLYAFVDGGHVGNLQNGIGGGTLASSGGGIRLAAGRFDASLELAVPLNADRLDTGNRRPRFSFRLSAVF